jgi:hypothetical protein
MTARAQSDQPLLIVYTGTPMVDVQTFLIGTGLAAMTVPLENRLAMAAKTAARIRTRGQAGSADGQPGLERAATGTKKRALKKPAGLRRERWGRRNGNGGCHVQISVAEINRYRQ